MDCTAQPGNEAVLMGLVGTFDTALALGRKSGDETNAETTAELAE
jgi:hypothetical protein